MTSPDTENVVLSKYIAIAGLGLTSWATWELYLKHIGDVASNLVPIISLIILLATLYTRLFAHANEDAAATTKNVLDAGKKAGALAAIVSVLAAAVMFWKSPVPKAITPQPFASTSVRKRSADDEGEDDADGDTSAAGAPPWYAAALKLLGTKEALPNGRANPAVKAMFAAVEGFDPKTVDCRAVPWCAVFQNYVLDAADIPGTRSAAARSFTTTPKLFKQLDAPRLGAIVVLSSDTRGPGAGHVAMYAGPGKKPGTIRLLGGNQSDSVCFTDVRENRVLGYYWPRSLMESRTVRGTAGAVAGTVVGGGVLVADAAGALPDDLLSRAKQTQDALEIARDQLEATGHPTAMRWATWLGFAALAIGVGAAVYSLWRQRQDHKGAS